MSRLRTKKLFLVTMVLGLSLIAKGLYIPVKAAMAQVLLQHAWEQSQQQQTTIKPWPWADTQPLAKLVIPKLNLNYIILSGSTGPSLAFAPGHLSGSAQPDEAGHVVLSAHRDTHFAQIGQLRIDDTVQIQSRSGKVKEYLIHEVRVVNTEHESLWLDHSANRLTLITCYPFDVNTAGGPLRYRIDAIQLT